jgi:hypothetical protein
MLNLIKFALFLAGVAAICLWVPIGGKTVVERIRDAGGPRAVAELALDDASKKTKEMMAADKQREKAKLPSKPTSSAVPAGRPSETHTESDAKAIEKILATRAK